MKKNYVNFIKKSNNNKKCSLEKLVVHFLMAVKALFTFRAYPSFYVWKMLMQGS